MPYGRDTHQSRSSYTAHLGYNELNELFRRHGLNPDGADQLQGVRYEEGQYFEAHYDWYPPYEGEQARTYTAIIYLNDDFEGGYTKFPKMQLTLTPRAGAMVYWDNQDRGRQDKMMLHEGSRVTGGTKYILTKFFRSY
jgi:prolyl 4-hydroxylase